MIKNWFITGDTHGPQQLKRRLNIFHTKYKNLIPEETGIIILGDVALNWYGPGPGQCSKDDYDKRYFNDHGYHLYILRGNHEMRPSTIDNVEMYFDENVHGCCLMQVQFPHIHYFLDGGECYSINNQSVITIPGAYSVDKDYRLSAGLTWFRDEQLSQEEMINLYHKILMYGDEEAVVLSHTCPLEFEPEIKYLFMDGIDQENVNKDTERFLDKILKLVPDYKYWYFGHFHDDNDFPNIRATILYNKIIPFGSTLEETL